MSKPFYFKQFSLAKVYCLILLDPFWPIRCNHSGPEWTWEWRQWRGTPYPPKLQHYWNLSIRLFSVIIQDTHWGSFTPRLRCSRCILRPQTTGPDPWMEPVMGPLPTHWWTLPNPILIESQVVSSLGWSAGCRDWIFDWQISLAYATTFLCILLLQYVLKLIPCSELSFRGPKLGPHQNPNSY